MRIGSGETSRNIAAAFQNRSLRRALIAFAAFRPTESAQWIAILVYAYGHGGNREIGIVALGMLVPTALLAPFLAQVGDRMSRERALALAYLAIGFASSVTGVAAAMSLPSVVFYSFAAISTIAISMVRPTHLSTLPELDRDVFLMREMSGLTYDEIADACELTPDAVRNRIHRARLQLRQVLTASLTPLRTRRIRRIARHY